MDGVGEANSYQSKLMTVTEGPWAGWSCYPGGDPFEDLAGPFYYRQDERGYVSAFMPEFRHMNGGGFMHGGCIMTFADFAIFVIARDELLGAGHTVTATFNGEFVGGAVEGRIVECRGEVVKAGRSMVFTRGLITQDDNPIMSFSAVIKKTGPRP
jgi:acyl-coenzyme A thioesterase PaaI-like protein